MLIIFYRVEKKFEIFKLQLFMYFFQIQNINIQFYLKENSITLICN